MYAYITGIVAEKGHNELVIETGGIGYQLMCSMNTVQNAVSARAQPSRYWAACRCGI